MQIFIYTYVLCLSLFPLCHSLNLSILSQCQTQMFTETWHFTHYWKGLSFSWTSGTKYPDHIQTMGKCTYNTLQHTVATEMWWFSVCQRKHTPDQQNMMLCSLHTPFLYLCGSIFFTVCVSWWFLNMDHGPFISFSALRFGIILLWSGGIDLLISACPSTLATFNLSPPPSCWAKS